MLLLCWPSGKEESAKQRKVDGGNSRSEEDARRMKSLNRSDFIYLRRPGINESDIRRKFKLSPRLKFNLSPSINR